MSVINTMLKDLERRGGNDAADDDVLRGLSSSAASKDLPGAKETNYYLISALSVLIVVLVAVIFYLVSPYKLVVSSKHGQISVAEQPVQALPDNGVTPVNTVEEVIEASLVDAKSKQSKVQQTVQSKEKSSLPMTEVVAAAEEPKPERRTTKPVQKRSAQNKAAVVEVMAVAAEEENIEVDQEISKTAREPTREEKSQEAYLNALSMYNRGRVQESRALLKDALNYDAYNLDARKLLSSLYLGEGKAGIAISIIEKGLARYSANQELLRLYLQAQVQLENYSRAIAIMEQRLRLSTPEDIAYLAGLYQKNEGHLSAVKLYSQALQLKPAKSVWWMGQGISFEALSQQKEALISYQQSIVSGQLSSQLAGYVKNRINVIEQLQIKSTS